MDDSNKLLAAVHFTTRQRRIITASYFACFSSLGACLASLGPVLLALAAKAGVGGDALGFLFVSRSALYLVGSIGAGWLVDRTRRTHVLLLGAMLLCACGTLGVAFLTSVPLLAIAISTQGACMGALDSGGNVMLIWLHGAGTVEPYMQAMHFFFGVGAFSAPLLLELVIATSDSFEPAYVVLCALLIASVAPLCFLRGPTKPTEEGTGDSAAEADKAAEGGGSDEAGRQSAAARQRWRQASVIALSALVLALCVGAEVGFGGYLFTHAVTVLSMSDSQGRGLTACYWGTFSVGRLLSVPLATRLSPAVLLGINLFGALVAAASFAFCNAHSRPVWTWWSTGAYGLFLSSAFPNVINHAERVLPVTGRILSILAACGAAGEMLVPLTIALWQPSAPTTFFTVPILVVCITQAAVFVALRAVARSMPLRVHEKPSTTTMAASEAASWSTTTELQVASST